MDPTGIPDKSADRVLGWGEKLAKWARDRVSDRRAARWERVVVSQPVANPDVFEGRGDDLGRLRDLFESRNVVWITGPPGIGKSALAGMFLRETGRTELARSFELSADSQLQDLLESVNAFLLDRNCASLNEELKRSGLTATRRTGALLRCLEPTSFVLVIESYEEVAHSDELPQLLQHAQERLAGAKLIVTSQQAPSWDIDDRRIHLGGLRPEESRRLLASRGTTERWQELHDAVDGCPKGLSAAAGVAKTWGVDVALEAAAGGGHPALGLFEEVYGRVMEPTRRMWALLAMLPGPFDQERVLELQAGGNAPSAWAQLIDCSVLDRRGDRWQMHSLARATGEKERSGQRRWPKQHGGKIARFYADFAERKAEDREAIEAQLENLLAAARLAFEYQDWPALWAMGYALDDPLDFAGRWTAREELLRLCYEGAGRAVDRQKRGEFGHNLAIVFSDRGEFEKAEPLYQQCLAIEREVRDRSGEAKTRHALAIVAQQQGKFDEAASECDTCLQLYRDLGMRPEEAMALHMKGMLAQVRGNLDEAEALYQQSLEIEQEVGDRPGEAKTLHQLGIVAQDRGKLEEAEALYRESLEIEREVGNRLGVAQSLHNLGMLVHDRGELAAAEVLYRQSLEIKREVRDRPGEATTLHQLGIVAEIRGKLEEAESFYRQSLEIEREIGNRPGEAISYHTLALLAEDQDNLPLAVERMQQASRMFEEMGLAEREPAKADLARLRKRLEEERS